MLNFVVIVAFSFSHVMDDGFVTVLLSNASPAVECPVCVNVIVSFEKAANSLFCSVVELVMSLIGSCSGSLCGCITMIEIYRCIVQVYFLLKHPVTS